MTTFYERCNAQYAASKNYYALAYDQDEVIDAASRGNEARFINHGCQPNLEVRKMSTLGDGVAEYEVGMWASRDIRAGEEVSICEAQLMSVMLRLQL
jgi:SET domain-containing protein